MGVPPASHRAAWRRAAVLLLLAWGVLAARRRLVAAFFEDGPPGPAPAPASSGKARFGPALRQVRVVLVDGLARDVARNLPVLSDLCARGLDLDVDVGFPTVSLPVQHVLWTGRTQQQSGIAYRVAPLSTPPPDGLPGAVAGAVAVAESHLGIAGSFGFARVVPGREDPTPPAYTTEAFEEAALAAVGSSAPLVFVHVLRVDEAGHAGGRVSRGYVAAARSADRLIGRIAAAAGNRPLLVLSDHGHLRDGGHGGAEPAIRIVRACLVGPWWPKGHPRPRPGAAPVHLVDLAAELAARFGVVRPQASGRPLAAAVRRPDPGATLPRPSPARWGGALLAAACVFLALGRGAGRSARGIPWAAAPWFFLAVAGFVAAHGPPTLSVPALYPPWGRDAAVASGVGLAAALVAGYASGGGREGTRRLRWMFALPASILAGAGVLVWGRPPLIPYVTGSVLLLAIVVGYGLVACAAGILAAAAAARIRGRG